MKHKGAYGTSGSMAIKHKGIQQSLLLLLLLLLLLIIIILTAMIIIIRGQANSKRET